MSYARNKRAKERRKNRLQVLDFEDIEQRRKEMSEKKKVESENNIKKLLDAEKILGEILVHGAMTYECEDCGKSWRMWLEIGVEGPNKIMPCPFIIRCKCGGMAKHINWNEDIWLPQPMPLGENMSYFKLDKKGMKKKDENTCGIPVIK